jgi:hypothetical protein
LDLLDGQIQIPGTSLGDFVAGGFGGGFFGGAGHGGVYGVVKKAVRQNRKRIFTMT